MSKQEIAVRTSMVAIGMTVTFLFLINLCDLIYQCGCLSTWNGGAATCNIHDAATHNCPWCTTGKLGAYLPLGVILLAQSAVAFWPGNLHLVRRFVLTLLMFPVAGGLVGLGFGLALGYW